MFYELAQLAIGNLLRARARLAMTAGGVLVGTAAVILLIALTTGLQNAAEAGIGQSGSLTEIYVYPSYNFGRDSENTKESPKLTAATVAEMWKIPGVEAVIPTMYFQGGIQITTSEKYTGYVQVMGVDPRLIPYLGLSASQGELRLGENEALVGAMAGMYFTDPKASDDNWEPKSVDLYNDKDLKIVIEKWGGSSPETRRLRLDIVGELTANNGDFDYAMLLPMSQVMALNEWLNDTEIDPKTFVYDQVKVRATSRETTNDVTTVLRDMGFQTGGMGDFLNQLNSFFGTMRLMLGGVGGVALLVAAFGVANTMTMAILERTKEIGLMKAIGATDRDVLTVFLIEAGLVGLSGGMAGVGVALLIQNVVNSALQNAPQSDQGGMMFLPIDPSQIGGNLFVISNELMIFALVLATLVGIGAGLYPALRAARMTPVIALKTD